MPGDINLFVSNGTCYIGQKEQADKAMIPCGNAANEHAACCQAGDNCLESSVCFNIEFGVTYVSGCTDPAYKHPSCPPKFLYQMVPATPWLGLSYCNGTSDEWVLCDQPQHPITLTKPDACWCPKDEDDRTATLSQASVIPGTASLPSKILGSIQFSVGHYPTLNPDLETSPTTASDAATGQSSSSAPTNSPATPTAQPTATDLAAPPDQANETGPSPSAKIGAIAGGVAGALVLLLLLAGILCLRRRRNKKRLQRQEEDRRIDNFINEGVVNKGGSATDPDPDPLGLGIGIAHGGLSPSPSSADASVVSELDSRAARPWSLRSELASNNSKHSHAPSPSRGSSGTAGGEGGQAARRAPSELAAHPIAELPG